MTTIIGTEAGGSAYVTDLGAVAGLSAEDRERLGPVTERYPFRASRYYLDRIRWDDPDDPLRRVVIPIPEELVSWGALDPSNEASNTVVPGVQHKYRDTVVVLTTHTCAAVCRYCFRKRLFMGPKPETLVDPDRAVAYVTAHPEVTDVLLTGGDPLILPTRRLRRLALAFARIPHVRRIRIGSRMPVFHPERITADPELAGTIREVRSQGCSVYVMTHFDHPRELSAEARAAVGALRRAGAQVLNQCPIVRGINDDPAVLAELLEELADLGAPQYYFFQMRPTVGNAPFAVPIVRGWEIVSEARRRVSGLARRVRFVMSHATGKVEIVGVDERHVYARYHRARDPADEDRMLVLERDDRARWLDELAPAVTARAA